MSMPRLAVGAFALTTLAAPNLRAAEAAGAVEGGPLLSIGDMTVIEGTGAGTTNAVFTVALSPISTLVVTVDFTTTDGTATSPADYSSSSGTISFAPGTATQTVTVPVVRDAVDEADEAFLVNLSNAVNAGIADGVGLAPSGRRRTSISSRRRRRETGTVNAASRLLSFATADVVTVDLHRRRRPPRPETTATTGTLSFASRRPRSISVPVVRRLDEPTDFLVISNSVQASITDGVGCTIADNDPV
jgi:hypothetical protein